MPLQAVALKKNRGGTSPVSKISDNEHTAASLGNSKELCVQDSVGPPIPDLPQRPEEGTKIPSGSAGQDAGDVFPDNPFRLVSVCNSEVGEHEVATRISQSFSESGNAEALAGSPADEDVWFIVTPLGREGHVTEVLHRRVVMGKHRRWELVDFGERQRPEAKRRPRYRRGFYPAANTEILHPTPFSNALLPNRGGFQSLQASSHFRDALAPGVLVHGFEG
jgi:hypothetical protein